jgi:hypothetical protein
MQPVRGANASLGASTSTLRSLVEALPEEYQEEFKKCTTGEDVLKGLQDYGVDWRTHIRRLGVFIQSMEPFFTAVDIFVQCDPIHAGTLWGALRVVIKVRHILVNRLWEECFISNTITAWSKFHAIL